MTIRFPCENPACPKILTVKDEHAGKRVQCPDCGQIMLANTPVEFAELVEDTDPPARGPNESTPYFHALAAFACQSNRLYRIYVRPDELVFIWAGSGMEGMAGAQAAGVQHGLIGALLGALLAKALDPTKKNAARKAVLDNTPLEKLIKDHPKNLRAPLDEFELVRIGPRSDRHAGTYSDHGHQALLHLRHRSLGKYRLGISSVEDVEIALRELPRVLGEVCQIDIEWSERDKKFVKRQVGTPGSSKSGGGGQGSGWGP